MKWVFCTIGFRNDDVREVIRKAAEIGYDEVEIIGKHIDGKSEQELDEIREIARKAGIGIYGVSPYLWLTQNEELLKESMAIAERFIAMARRLGARMFRTFTDAGPTGIGSAVATPAHWRIAVESLQKITAMAPELLFALEMHEKTLADTPETANRVLREVNQPNLQLIFQPFENRSSVDDYLVVEKNVRHVHLNPCIGKGPNCGMAESSADYAALLRCLAQRNYKYTCAVEFCGPKGTTWDEVRETLAWCKQLTGQKA